MRKFGVIVIGLIQVQSPTRNSASRQSKSGKARKIAVDFTFFTGTIDFNISSSLRFSKLYLTQCGMRMSLPMSHS
jgi:hypothetical protein